MGTITLKINGVLKYFISLHYRKEHPNSDPDTFDITMDEAEAADVLSFQTVLIEKGGFTEFYGFVEEITPDEDAENGTDVVITGRCWKLITWKKWNERFQESRDVGPMETDGNVETGFFGSVNPTELFKFFLRCPISVHPLGKVRHKIGWGIPSDNWICCANETAEARYPDWVALRYTGLAWRGRGDINSFFTDLLIVDSFDNTYPPSYGGFGVGGWGYAGTSPWLDTDDGDTNKIVTPFLETGYIGNFSFPDLGVSRIAIYEVKLCIKLKHTGWDNQAKVHLHDGSSWHEIADLKRPPDWEIQEIDVSSILNTVTKINAAKVKFEATVIGWGQINITYMYLQCKTGTVVVPIAQQDGDYFVVNLGGPYDRVAAILLECRNNPICYPEHYSIQYTTLSNCCDPIRPPRDNEWIETGVSISDNIYRDVIHSWSPIDGVHGIRIKITANGTNPWEISQIYVYQADEDNYRLLDD